MPYATIDQIQEYAGGSQALLELTDLEGAGEINSALVASTLAEVESQMNAYIGKVRRVPLADPVPAFVSALAVDETVFRLMQRRRMVGQDDTIAHEGRIRQLEAIAKGEITLGVEPQPAPSAQNSPSVALLDDARSEMDGFA